MRTHELARALRHLADVLKKAPDVELSELELSSSLSGSPFLIGGKFQPEKVGGALSVLAGLSKINKQHWRQLIEYFDWPISIDSRDSSRNIVGRVLNFLETNPQAYDRLRRSPSPGTSPALMKALQALLEDHESGR